MAPVTASYLYRYRTDKVIAQGTYATVKEAEHISTHRFYACKIMNKKKLEEKEYNVKNEIEALKKLSTGHRNIVTLYDYFETAHSIHLCFDLCTGGSLFDRIRGKERYREESAATLIRTIMSAVKYIHECGIIHRNLHPENLLFRTKEEDADIMIIGFGMSHIINHDESHLLRKVFPGPDGYMAPEIFKQTGHEKPVDVWAMGAITYFLFCGCSPFDRETRQEKMVAAITGDYRFKPEQWQRVSKTARQFIEECLRSDPAQRPTAAQALKHKWLTPEQTYFVPSPTEESTSLVAQIEQAFDPRKAFRKAGFTVVAVKRMTTLAGVSPTTTPTTPTFDRSIAEVRGDERNVINDDS